MYSLSAVSVATAQVQNHVYAIIENLLKPSKDIARTIVNKGTFWKPN